MKKLALSGKSLVGVIIVAALSVSVAATYAVVSATSAEFGAPPSGCHSASCKVVDYRGAKYELTGKALAQFNILHDSKIPYEAAQLQAAYIPTGGQITLAIEGSNIEAQKLVESYNIEVLTSKTHDTEDNAVIIGSMSDADFKKFLAENSLEGLEARNIMIAPVGGYTTDDVEITGLNSFLDEDAQQKIASSLDKFEEQKIGEILSSEEGVKKVG